MVSPRSAKDSLFFFYGEDTPGSLAAKLPDGAQIDGLEMALTCKGRIRRYKANFNGKLSATLEESAGGECKGWGLILSGQQQVALD